MSPRIINARVKRRKRKVKWLRYLKGYIPMRRLDFSRDPWGIPKRY